MSANPLQAIKEAVQNQNWICLQLLMQNPNEAPVAEHILLFIVSV